MTDAVKLTIRLNNVIGSVCPIDGVALDMPAHKIRVDYQSDATPEQLAAAQAVIDGFDWSDDAQQKYDIQARAMVSASDPGLQYVLSQLGKAIPAYAMPDKVAIAADISIQDSAKGK